MLPRIFVPFSIVMVPVPETFPTAAPDTDAKPSKFLYSSKLLYFEDNLKIPDPRLKTDPPEIIPL